MEGANVYARCAKRFLRLPQFLLLWQRWRMSVRLCARHEMNALPGGGIDGRARIKQREVLGVAPHLRKIAIVRAVRIAGFARQIHGARVIPVADRLNAAGAAIHPCG